MYIPGFPYFSTGDARTIAAAAFVILAFPPAPISTTGGIIVLDVLESTVDGDLFLEATAVANPPPTTAPAAKQAAWRKTEFGIGPCFTLRDDCSQHKTQFEKLRWFA